MAITRIAKKHREYWRSFNCRADDRFFFVVANRSSSAFVALTAEYPVIPGLKQGFCCLNYFKGISE